MTRRWVVAIVLAIAPVGVLAPLGHLAAALAWYIAGFVGLLVAVEVHHRREFARQRAKYPPSP